MAGLNSLYNTEEKPTDKPIPYSDQFIKEADERKEEVDEENDTFLLGVIQAKLRQNWNRPKENKWADFETQYEAATNFNDDGSADVNRPIERATVRNKMADELSMKPIITLKPQEPSDIYKVDVLKKLWDFVWVESDTDKNLIDVIQCKNIFGTGWWYEGLHTERFTRYVPEIQKDGTVIQTKKEEERSWLKGYALDLRDVWVDPVSDIDLAEWCFIRDREFDKEMLKQLKNDPNYINIDEALEWTNTTNQAPEFTTETERTRNAANNQKYCRWFYFCYSKGQMIEAIGSVSGTMGVIIRRGANPYAHGQLPVSPLVDHKNYKEIYGTGECELLETSKYEINSIENQIIDYARESNTVNFAIGDGVTFKDSELIGGVMRIWNFKGDVRNTQMIKPPSMDSGLNVVREMLENNATVDTGIDNKILMGSPTDTAYQAKLQEQAKLKGINVSMKNLDIFYQRIFRQRLANIQQFMPTTTGRRIVGNSAYRTIPVEDTQIEEPKNVVKNTIGNIPKMTPKDGITSFLEIKPSMIKNNMDIAVETPTTSPILRELEKEDKRNAIKETLELASANPEIFQELNIRNIIRESITDYDIDPDRIMKSKEKQDTKDVRQAVLDKLPQPPQASTQPQRAKQEFPNTSTMQQPTANTQQIK